MTGGPQRPIASYHEEALFHPQQIKLWPEGKIWLTQTHQYYDIAKIDQ